MGMDESCDGLSSGGSGYKKTSLAPVDFGQNIQPRSYFELFTLLDTPAVSLGAVLDPLESWGEVGQRE